MASNTAGRPGGQPVAPLAEADAATGSATGSGPAPAPAKKRKHRGGKKRRNRRESFIAQVAPIDSGDMTDDQRPPLRNTAGQSHSRANSSFYRLRNHSNTSLESETLLDHRDQSYLPARRQSVQMPDMMQPRPSHGYARPAPASNPFGRSKLSRQQRHSQTDEDDDEDDEADDRTPLMSMSQRDIKTGNSYGGTGALSSSGRLRRGSRSSAHNNNNPVQRPGFPTEHHQSRTNLSEYNVNNPPSMPASPVVGPEVGFDDVMITADLERSRSPEESRSANHSRDVLIDIEEAPSPTQQHDDVTAATPKGANEFRRRLPALDAPDDVCFPIEGMSEIGEQDYMQRTENEEPRSRRRRRRWPDLNVLEEWTQEEKEQRTIEGMRARKVSEPLMVGGRLRPQKRPWHREPDDAPYRFTYFNEEFDNTVHSQTIGELVQPGQTFRDLFIPERPVIEDSSDSDSDDEEPIAPLTRDTTNMSVSGSHSRQASTRMSELRQPSSGEPTRSNTPAPASTTKPDQERPKRYGPRPAFWLDVLSPTDAEMKVISKAFSIHPLTAEDILMQEQREKVELFKHYYFINYRTFEQDENSEDYLEPVNLYVVVFREGVISFHFSMTPHPANVRRRIRQLQDYLILSPDWISYGIIDDITDAYAPLIQRIEDEVDEIDEAILALHSEEEEQEAKKSKSASYNNPHYEKQPEGTKEQQENGRDMLRRVGECRKKVMSLYRLLGNKADVIKGFAKRCNEHWDVAPRSEIGLYLGDIQDHIVTMTGNLSHYEK
jgi:magnesium transporter